MSWFVPVRTSDLIPAERMSFPEEWNMNCLGDVVAMRPPPPGKEEIPKPSKENKRKRGSPANSSKPMKSKARKPKADTVALSTETAQCLRSEEEEREDDDCLLVVRKRGNTDDSKYAEPMVVDAVHSRTEEISDGSSRKILKPSGSKRTPRLGGHLEGETEGPGPETLQREENAPSGTLGVINVDESPPAFSKSRAELARCEAGLKKLSEERDGLRILYVKKEGEISDLRAELEKARSKKRKLVKQLREELKMNEAETLGWRQGMDRLASEKDTLWEQLASIERQLQSVKEESLARSHIIEELEAKSPAELAKAKSDAEAFISSYRADAEASNTRAKEISAVAEVKLSSALDHAKRQSQKEALEEVHARGFDLSADIEKAKTLEEEVAALLSDDEDSASGSKSRGDEDEVPEEEVPEDAAPEDIAAEDVALE
ncbi:PREDICTED: uncharacterized protein LOC109237157 [Nicotiana attenuata]|uniref:uncharacterized protein LOC109237157 n=1 Tax=Nicotiana attenuata TaxID=49451 RepID=UPI0009049A0D|nr:PREDICTED: uncharacterized protein LOC109237157 [Nicotiana attenuata]